MPKQKSDPPTVPSGNKDTVAGGAGDAQEPSPSFAERVEEAARRLKRSSEDKSLEHDGDRGQEGNKTQRVQEQKLFTDDNPSPPLPAPKDDIA